MSSRSVFGTTPISAIPQLQQLIQQVDEPSGLVVEGGDLNLSNNNINNANIITANNIILSTDPDINVGNVIVANNNHRANVSNPHSVSASQVGLENVTNESKATMFNNPSFTGTITNPTLQTALSESSNHRANVLNPHSVSASHVGLGNVDNESKSTMFNNPSFTGAILINSINLESTLNESTNHSSNVSNPHSVNTLQLGLENVTNESKATMFDNPSFTGTITNPTLQTALSESSNHRANVLNPHSVSASQVGLGNVTNESKTTMFNNPTMVGLLLVNGDVSITNSLTVGGVLQDTSRKCWGMSYWGGSPYMIVVNSTFSGVANGTALAPTSNRKNVLHTNNNLTIIDAGYYRTSYSFRFDASIKFDFIVGLSSNGMVPICHEGREEAKPKISSVSASSLRYYNSGDVLDIRIKEFSNGGMITISGWCMEIDKVDT